MKQQVSPLPGETKQREPSQLTIHPNLITQLLEAK